VAISRPNTAPQHAFAHMSLPSICNNKAISYISGFPGYRPNMELPLAKPMPSRKINLTKGERQFLVCGVEGHGVSDEWQFAVGLWTSFGRENRLGLDVL
jgi:hypothetical protein